RVEAFLRGRVRVQPRRRPCLRIDQVHAAIGAVCRGNQPLRTGDSTRSSGPAWPQTNRILPTASQPAARGALVPDHNAIAKTTDKASVAEIFMAALLTARDATLDFMTKRRLRPQRFETFLEPVSAPSTPRQTLQVFSVVDVQTEAQLR